MYKIFNKNCLFQAFNCKRKCPGGVGGAWASQSWGQTWLFTEEIKGSG